MKTHWIILLTLVLFGFQACQQAEQSFAQPSKTAEYELEEDMFMDEQHSQTPVSARKIIKNAEIRFQVNELKQSTAEIEAYVTKVNGFIAQSESDQSEYRKNQYMTIRIPGNELDAFIDMLEKKAIYLDYNRISSRDVTEEFMDIETRLEIKKEVRDRYIDILRNRAQTVAEVLDAEEKIRVIQEEIESAEGRLKFLSNQVALSTVQVSMYQKVPYQDRPTLSQKPLWLRVKNSFIAGWVLIQDMIVGFIGIWPIILIFGLLLWNRRRMMRFFRR